MFRKKFQKAILFFLLAHSFSGFSKTSFFSQGLFNFKDKHPIEVTGDIFMILLPTTSLILNLSLEKNKEGLKQNLLSTGVNIITTSLLKFLLNEVKLGSYKVGTRPNGAPYNMPSGHTSIVFTSSFHVLKRYGFVPSIPFLALASFTAFSRLHARKHDAQAVIAGALLGFGASFLFTSSYQKTKVGLGFNPSKNQVVFSYAKNF